MFFTANVVQAQLPGEGLETRQNPPGVKWKTIDTPHFQIVFPPEISADAQRIANTLEHIHEADWRSLGKAPRRIPLLLHTRNTTSNGFVTIAPHRSEWFNTPPQVGLTGSTQWYDLLAVHEFRHVVQYSKLNQGFNRILYYLFGEIGWAAGAAFSVPLWSWEGDAVVMETALTRSGRGRMAEFDLPIRAMLLSGVRHSYNKMTLGSYRDWFADPYSYGFFINTFVRRQNGPGIWSTVLDNTSRYSFMPYRFSHALRRATGMGVVQTHAAAMNELAALWQDKHSGQLGSRPEILDHHRSRFLTHYISPQACGDGSFVVLKYGFADQAAFVRLDERGKEAVLFHPNETDGAPHSIVGDFLVWAEKRYDPRWGYRDYFEICSYHLKTGEKKTLTHSARLFAPALSPDGCTIVAVAHENDNSNALVLLDAGTGREIRRLPNPANDFIMTPRWSPDGGRVVYNRLAKSGRALSFYDIQADSSADLLPPGHRNTGLPVFYDRYVLFNSDEKGIDAIYAIDIETKQIWQVVSTRYGAWNPAISANGRKILFNDYDVNGYHVAESVIDNDAWIPLEQVPDQSIHYYQPLVDQEAGPQLLETVPAKEWPVKEYRAWKNLFKVHSWSPAGDPKTETYGVSLASLNLLGTMQSKISALYNANEHNGHVSAGLSYGGFYPLIDLQAGYGVRTSTYRDDQRTMQRYSWREKTLDAGVRLPLNLSRGGYRTGLTLRTWLGLTNIGGISDPVGFSDEENSSGWLRTVGYDLIFFRSRGAYADIFPVWGQILTVGFRHTPLQGDYQGQLATAEAVFFTPGLMPRHGFRLAAAYEAQVDENYRFASELAFPRGYEYTFSTRIAKASIDYALPLFYPDRNLTGLVYVRRLRADLFYDHGILGDGDPLRSAGLELVTDFHLLAIPVPVSLGLRYSHRFEDDGARIELIAGLAP